MAGDSITMADREFKIRITSETKGFSQGAKDVVKELNRVVPAEVSEGFEKIQTLIGRFTTSSTGILGGVVAILGTVLGLFKKTVDNAREIERLAVGSQTTTGQAQAISFGAGKAGIPPQAITYFLDLIRQKQGEVVAGSKEAEAAFKTFGLTADEAIKAEPYELLLRVFREVRSGKDGAEKFNGAVSLLGRGFRELAPAVRAGLGEWIEGFERSRDLIDRHTIENLADVKKAENSFWAERRARLSGNLALLGEAIVTGWRKIGARVQAGWANLFFGGRGADEAGAKLAEDLARRLGEGGPGSESLEGKLEQRQAARKAKREREFKEARAREAALDKQGDDLRLQNEEKIARHQFDSLSPSEKRLAIEKEIARITEELDHDKLANELEVQQAIARRLELQDQLRTLQPKAELPQPDQFARMGLYLTSGAQGYSTMVGLQRQTIDKLDAILEATKNVGPSVAQSL